MIFMCGQDDSLFSACDLNKRSHRFLFYAPPQSTFIFHKISLEKYPASYCLGSLLPTSPRTLWVYSFQRKTGDGLEKARSAVHELAVWTPSWICTGWSRPPCLTRECFLWYPSNQCNFPHPFSRVSPSKTWCPFLPTDLSVPQEIRNQTSEIKVQFSVLCFPKVSGIPMQTNAPFL